MINNCTNLNAPRVSNGGSWLDWRDAWRDMGRTEDDIAAEDSRRTQEAAAQCFVYGKGTGDAQARRRRAAGIRTRTWGHCDALTLKMRARIAPLAGYFLKAIKNEFTTPTWGLDGRAEMTLRRLYLLACGGQRGIFAAADAVTRWRDFRRVREWCLNVLRRPTEHGFTDAEAETARRWLSSENVDTPLILPHFTDTRARVSFYESKKTFYTTTPAEAGFSPLAHAATSAATPLVGACAFSAEKGEALNEERVTDSAPASAPLEQIARFPTGVRFPRRLWWLVWKWLPAFGRLHYGNHVEWSEPHFVAWFKSCLFAGKRCADLFDLYEEKLMRWHGLASDWQKESLHPRGLFSELYKAAAKLPACKDYQPPQQKESLFSGKKNSMGLARREFLRAARKKR